MDGVPLAAVNRLKHLLKACAVKSSSNSSVLLALCNMYILCIVLFALTYKEPVKSTHTLLNGGDCLTWNSGRVSRGLYGFPVNSLHYELNKHFTCCLLLGTQNLGLCAV